MIEHQSPNLPSQLACVSSIDEVVEPVLKELQKFNPGVDYQWGDVKQTIRKIIQQGKIDGSIFSPDKIHIPAIATDSAKFKLLVAHSCKIYVDLVLEPRVPGLKRKRVSKEQKQFAFELDCQIHELENPGGSCISF